MCLGEDNPRFGSPRLKKEADTVIKIANAIARFSKASIFCASRRLSVISPLNPEPAGHGSAGRKARGDLFFFQSSNEQENLSSLSGIAFSSAA